MRQLPIGRVAAIAAIAVLSVAAVPSVSAGRLAFSVWLRLGAYELAGFSMDGMDSRYIGAQGRLGLEYAAAPGLTLFATAGRRGPSGYDGPLSRRYLTAQYGRVHRFTGGQWWPRVESAGIDWRVTGNIWAQAGMIKPLETGLISVDQKFANFGLSGGAAFPRGFVRFHWDKPDLNNRWDLGEKTDGELFFEGDDTRADFLQGVAGANGRRWSVTAGLSALIDRTPPDRRVAWFGQQINRDVLGLATVAGTWRCPLLDLRTEYARNFGRASGPMAEMRHEGWFVQAEGRFRGLWVEPGFRVIRATGQQMSKVGYFSGRPEISTNRAFSVYSPANLLLFDTRYPIFVGPYIMTGSGYALNYGIMRPGLFGDPHVPENLRANALTVDINRGARFTAQIAWWRMETDVPAVGMRGGAVINLPRDLGEEWNVYARYQVTPSCSVNIIGGVLELGDYYRAKRDDLNPYWIFPLPPDQSSERMYQLEIGWEWML